MCVPDPTWQASVLISDAGESCVVAPSDQPHAAFEEAVVGVVQTDADGRMTYANPRWCAMLGYAREELLAKTVFDITHPACLASTRDVVERLRGGAPATTLQKRYVRKDGSVLHARSSVSAHRDARQAFVGVTAIVVDETDQIVAVEQARQAEERLREALALGQMVAWEWDLGSNTLVSSSDLAEFWGTPIRNPSDFLPLLHPDDREHVQQAIRTDALEETPSELAYRVVSPDGRVRHIQSRRQVDLGPDGKPIRVRGIAIDLTTTRRAEMTTRVLAEASDTLGASLDYEVTLANLARVFVPNLADWYAVDLLDGAGELQRVSVHHADPEKIALGNRLHERFPPRRDVPAGPWRTLTSGEPSWMPELTDAMFREGATSAEHYDLLRTLGLRSFLCVPLRARDRSIGVLTLAYAESGRRYTQDDVELALQVAQRAAVAVDNAQLFRALQETDRRKNEFLAMLAHELRNPLAPVSMAADLLRTVLPHNAQAVEAADIIRRQVSHMTELVEDLVDVSRLTRGLAELEHVPVDMRAVVAAAMEQAQALVQRQRHTLHARLAPDALFVIGDRARLIQVVANLLTNAAKYTPPGGEIVLDLAPHGDTLQIRVADNGIGIEPALLPSVFDLFTQGERTPDRSQGGLGIGLALVRSLVHMHGGDVRAQSAGSGRGSVFTVVLPRAGDASHPIDDQTTSPPAPTRAAAYPVLVVDDNVDAAAMVAAVLEANGHPVTVATTAHDALTAATSGGPFACFVLDIGLPDLSGYELARRLRSMAENKAARFIALTGYDQPHDRAAALDAGFDIHLAKPADAARLLESLG